MTLETMVGTFLLPSIIIGILLRLQRTFGEYTISNRRAHESNLLVQQENINITDRLKRIADRLPPTYTPHHDKKESA